MNKSKIGELLGEDILCKGNSMYQYKRKKLTDLVTTRNFI